MHSLKEMEKENNITQNDFYFPFSNFNSCENLCRTTMFLWLNLSSLLQDVLKISTEQVVVSMAACWHQASWRAKQNRAGCPWAGSYHNKAKRPVWKTRPNSCPLGPGLKLERKLWKRGGQDEKRGAQRGGESRGYETRPDGLACRERDSCWGLRSTAGEGEMGGKETEGDSERRSGPRCKNGGIVFLPLKALG